MGDLPLCIEIEFLRYNPPEGVLRLSPTRSDDGGGPRLVPFGGWLGLLSSLQELTSEEG